MADVSSWCSDVLRDFPSLQDKFPERSFCVCPPFVYLAEFSAKLGKLISTDAVSLGGQDLSAWGSGAYTGEINAKMLKDLSCAYVLIGHSERRTLFQESEESLTAKLRNALAAGVNPIFCIGESEEEREENKTNDVLQEQLNPIIKLLRDGLYQDRPVIIAYEPVWAIGTGKAATAEIATSAHTFIRAYIKEHADNISEEELRILYGGSVKPDNAKSFVGAPGVDGLLVGGASLDAASILAIFAV